MRRADVIARLVGDRGPFLVCRRARFDSLGKRFGAFKSFCALCKKGVWVPGKRLNLWRDDGSLTVCGWCARRLPGTVMRVKEVRTRVAVP